MHHELCNGHKEMLKNGSAEEESRKASVPNGHHGTPAIPDESQAAAQTQNDDKNLLSEAKKQPTDIARKSSRRCSSDGALVALQGAPRPPRGHSFSDSDEKTQALKARIRQKYEQFEKEMAEKATANGLTCAILEVGGIVCALKSPDPRVIPPEDTCIFTSGGPASMTCELTDSALPGKQSLLAEVKEVAYSRLQKELQKAQLELKLKDEEVVKLSQIRDEVGTELEELTASLFEEANNMVRDANVKQAYAEKLLKESNLKIEVLQAEVQALKTLVITSTPSMPNPHLHPQIDKRSNGVRSLFTQGHRRSPSNYELCSFKDTPPGSPTKDETLHSFSPSNYEIDPVFNQQFLEWHQSPNLDKTNPFLQTIYVEDILPCLNFTNSKLCELVLSAIEENAITIEQVNGKNPFPKKCSLLESTCICKYRMRLGSDMEWHYISQLCRNRIAAVCDLFCYIRYIQQGLVKSGVHEVYWEVIKKRRDVTLAKLGILSL